MRSWRLSRQEKAEKDAALQNCKPDVSCIDGSGRQQLLYCARIEKFKTRNSIFARQQARYYLKCISKEDTQISDKCCGELRNEEEAIWQFWP